MKPLSERIAAMEAQAAKPAGSVHSRFIPREEIDGVAAWHFAAVDGSEPRPALRTEADAAMLPFALPDEFGPAQQDGADQP